MGAVRASLVVDPLWIPDEAEVIVTKSLRDEVLEERIDVLARPAPMHEIEVTVVVTPPLPKPEHTP